MTTRDAPRRLARLSMALLAGACFGAAGPRTVAAEPAALVASHDAAIVDTEAGKLQGFIHHGIFTYRGIPYAKAERFMPPHKPVGWQGVRTALSYGYICPQVQSEKLNDIPEFVTPHRYWITNEDCLNLNVWTPSISDGKHRPVMVWIHGGGFKNGSSIEQVAYDGENISRKGDVVLVSVNHRLNSLGFLDLSAYGSAYKQSANVGMMDLVAALQWVKANIERFGGDPGNVTVFGQSGGGGKITTLMAAPAAKGLFHKAIIESGSIRGMGMTLTDRAATQKIADFTLQNLAIPASQVERINTISYDRLQEASEMALNQVSKLMGVEGLLGRGLTWAPVVDGEFLPAQPFDTSAPLQSKDIPLLVGSTLNEFPLAEFNPRTRASSQWTPEQLQRYLKEAYGSSADAVRAAYQKAYPGLKTSEWLYVDTIFRPGAIETAQMKSDQHGAPVFLYLFAWQSAVLDGWGRSGHCKEIPFVFNNVALADGTTGASPAAFALERTMTDAWVHFARSGTPSAAGLPAWPAYTRDNGATMIIDNKSEVRMHHDEDLMALLPPKH